MLLVRAARRHMNFYEMIFGVAAVMSAAEQEQGQAFLTQHAADPATVTLSSGLQYQVLASTTHEGLPPRLGSRCSCNFKGSLLNGTVYASALGDHNTTLVAGNFIKGVDEALLNMKEGDKWALVVPPELGYGPRGFPPTVPGNATLLIELELLKISPPGMFTINGVDYSKYMGLILMALFQVYQLFLAPSEADKRKGKPLTVEEASSKTHARVFFEVHVGGKPAGRLEFELFQTHFPKTTENFRALCTGEKGAVGGEPGAKKLHYAGCPMHRVIPGFVCQGGDITRGNGTGGASIYQKGIEPVGFDDEFENGVVGHTQPYLLSMASVGSFESNKSQFFITFAKLAHLDGKHVVFGRLVAGEAVMKAIEAVGSGNGRPYQPVTIAACGEVAEGKAPAGAGAAAAE